MARGISHGDLIDGCVNDEESCRWGVGLLLFLLLLLLMMMTLFILLFVVMLRRRYYLLKVLTLGIWVRGISVEDIYFSPVVDTERETLSSELSLIRK
ncbi:hypothetical protein EYZ11_007433 [Aspergillus tanneri]|uniref:Uncharacterized protein n=1 Tax=Aspergillus tanneri TaxID=1220188 RepID=A0A4S3JDG8_9EURO|nr:hypothetical protein EYZ11_007433 [Aspergillus tanneri]